MAYDSADGYVVLFGGLTSSGGAGLGDTWKFSNGHWTQIIIQLAPSFRILQSMTYDTADGYIVLFGGFGIAGSQPKSLHDTWKFSNGAWSNITGTTGPSPRLAAAMTYDGLAADAYVVLFGGLPVLPPPGASVGNALGDTWKFSGGTWTNITGATGPIARAGAMISYDSADGYVLLYGGAVQSSVLSDTWKFSGGSWSSLASSNSPGPRALGAMAYDAATGDNYMIFFGGGSTTNSNGLATSHGDTWKYSGGTWTNITATGPPPQFGSAIAYDASATDGYVLLLGIGGVSWKFSGGPWTAISVFSIPGPSPRFVASMTYDAVDGYVVLFGGFSGRLLGDTWKFVGGVWTNISSTSGPSPRAIGAMTFDDADGYVILFGGGSGVFNVFPSTPLRDTWKFLGGSWTNITASSGPSPRFGASLVYDATDRYSVLFGGFGTTGILRDTWKFSAGSWTNVTGSSYPPTRFLAAMSYDATDGYVVLFGGLGVGGSTATVGHDTWKFQGGSWTNITTSAGPSGRYAASMEYDAADRYVLLFGGGVSSGPYGDTWRFIGGAWTNITTSFGPPARFGSSMANDVADSYVLLFGGLGGGTGFSDTWTWGASAAADFSISAVPSSVTIAQGYTISIKLIFTSTGGFSGTIYYNNALPNPGLDQEPSSVSLAPNGMESLNVIYSIPSSTTPGSYSLSIPWTSGTLSHTVSIPVTVTTLGSQPGLTVSITPSSLIVPQGTSKTATVTLKSLNSFAGSVTLYSFFAFPLTATLTPKTVSLTAGQTVNVDLSIAAQSSTTPGTYSVDAEAFNGTGTRGPYDSGFITVVVPSGGVAAWTQVTTASSPPPRFAPAIAYDAADGYVILFGGAGGSGLLGDTWKFQAGSWTQLSPSTAPSPRDAAAMVYDAADGYVILFGGAGGSGLLGDAWKFQTGTWTQISSTVSPPARYGAGIAFDAADGYVVLFGGLNSSATHPWLGDTWKFQAGVWTQIQTSTAPSSRYVPSMTYDLADAYVVLFGGSGSTSRLGDTWKFQSGSWTPITTTISPSPREYASMSYDASAGYVLLFGGFNNAYYGDTYQFKSGSWTLIATSIAPSARTDSATSFDANDGYVVLFGGTGAPAGTGRYLGDTWTFGPTTSASFDFSLSSPSPASLTVTQGSGSQSASITATLTMGTSVPLTLSASGLPTGVIAIFPNDSCSPTCTVTVFFLATPTATLGVYSVSIDASGGSVHHSVMLSLTVGQPVIPFDYTLSAGPSSASIVAGETTSFMVTATLSAGTSETISLVGSITPLPTICQPTASSPPGTSPCGSVNISPQSLAPTATGATFSITLTTTSVLPAGTYQIYITGSPSGASRSSTVFSLTVNSPPTPDFTISADPTSLTLSSEDSENCHAQGQGMSCDDEGLVTITIKGLNGFTGTVAVSVSSSPHLDTSLSAGTITTSTSSTLTIREAAPGTYVLTITGTFGSLLHHATVSVTVRSPEKLKCGGGNEECQIESDAPLQNVNFAGHTIHFTMTGDAGTTGVANVTVARSAVPDINRIKVFVNHNRLSSSDVTITSDGNNFYISFKVTFHSNVDVDIDLNPAANTILGLDPTIFYTVAGALVALVVILVAVVAVARRRRAQSVAQMPSR